MSPPAPEPNRDEAEIERLLTASRPVPRAAFRGDLRRRLTGPGGHPRFEQRLRLVIGAYAGSGGLLLAVVALGIAGLGPLSS